MDSYAPLREKSINTDLGSLIGICPDGPVEKMAVLFTDLVGSTNYFKVHGDNAGLEMLQEHYGIATSVINEHGGKLIKALGDSVMASFIGPVEAFKSAIKMQQQFSMHNKDKNTQNQLPVRIGIHYGNVIVEEKDIYGDVVNIAAKLTNMAEGGQIYISQEVHELTKYMLLVHFELINVWVKKTIPDGLKVYKVIWDEEVELDPAVHTMLYLEPLWRLCEERFKAIWDSLLEAKDELWGGKHNKERILSDKSILLTMKESAYAFIVAGKVLDFLKGKIVQEDADAFLPVRMIIDIDPFPTEGKGEAQATNNRWDDINPGEIYISSEAYAIIKQFIDIPGHPIEKRLGDRVFYKVLSDENGQEDHSLLLRYKEKMVQGGFSPCYYCGDKKHRPVDCPSKTLPDLTHGIEKLGYLSIKDIGELMLKYILTDGFDPDIPLCNNEGDSKSIITMHHGFFELKRVFQLRFFRTIWGAVNGEWSEIRESKGVNGGGFAWLAQDLLRVSDLDRAEFLLKNALDDNQGDYRVYCTLGYLNVERGSHLQAEQYFNSAYQYAKSDSQKTFILLLLYRLYMLNNDYDNARKEIKNILMLNPGCIDAIYQDIILRFYEKDEKSAIQRLIKLIQKNRVYFIYALIDPDLKLYGDIIYSASLKLFHIAKKDAQAIFREAEEEVERSIEMLDVQGVAQAQSVLLKTRRMLEADSYFSYIDAIHYSDSVISICRKLIKERRETLLKSIHQLNGQVEKGINFVRRYRYPRFVNPHKKQLVLAKENLQRVQDTIKSATGEQIGELEKFFETLSAELTAIGLEFDKLDAMQQTLINFTRFIKRSAVFLSIVFFIGIFAVPLAIPYLDTVLSRTENTSMWFYEKSFLAVGSVVSIAVSAFLTIRNILRGD